MSPDNVFSLHDGGGQLQLSLYLSTNIPPLPLRLLDHSSQGTDGPHMWYDVLYRSRGSEAQGVASEEDRRHR